jgi:GGDEF domain-containing protein
MHNDKNKFVNNAELNEIRSDLILLRKQLFSDDITKTKNRLWISKEKLSDNETFNDFGFMVSIKLSDYDTIVKEYDPNVGNRLLKQVSDYMIGYMKEYHLKHEIVRYKDENFLIFLHEVNEEEVEEYMVNMQKSMSNYKFKYRSRIFMLTFHFAVMQYIENESFSSVLDQLDEKLFQNKT